MSDLSNSQKNLEILVLQKLVEMIGDQLPMRGLLLTLHHPICDLETVALQKLVD